MNLRCVNDIRRNCALNIALDEVFFTKEPFESIFRFYRWTEPAYTIGYFQKISTMYNVQCTMYNKQQTANDKTKSRHCEEQTKSATWQSSVVFSSKPFTHSPVHPFTYPVVRRLTGGLAILHNTDLSYSLVVSDEIWKHIYDQEKTYKIIHENIRKALAKINIFAMYDVRQQKIGNDKEGKSFSCVQTLYKDDLLLNGRKIVGSCQRRRGKKILVEGSIHLNLSDEQVNIFTQEIFKLLSEELKCTITNNTLTAEEISAGEILCTERYNNEKWNNLF